MTTTSTTTATPTPTASSVVSSAAQSLLTSLSTGSGVDTSSLVTSLVNAQYATQSATLKTRYDTLTSQISGVASVRSAITSFSSALSSLVKGGTLQTQPVSGDTAVFTATARSGAKLAGLSSSIGVSQLAAAQTAVSAAAVADHTAAIGTGQLTLTLGTATYASDGSAMTGFTAGSASPVTIDITGANDSLDGIAAAINAKRAGVTAAVVTDADGSAYLSLKGATGKAQAFTLQATTDDSGNLARFDVGVGATGTRLTSTAQNARLTVDGVAVERASNTIGDLVGGVNLKLTGTSTSAVSLTSTTPTDALSGAVSDFVDAYNQVIGILTAQTDPVNGVLKSDTAAAGLLRQLKGMTLANLTGAADGTPTTLAAIGVTTNKDGTLAVDATALTKAMAATPQAIEAMFAYSPNASTGLNALLTSLTAAATDTTYGLGASTASYTAAQGKVTDAESDLADREASMTTRLTSQFAAMQTAVTSYKSVQSFLTGQIAQWNKSSS